jgi:hypothetical protein
VRHDPVFFSEELIDHFSSVFGNALVGRDSVQRDEYLVFSICSENISYVFCGFYISVDSPAFHVMFSTVSEVQTPRCLSEKNVHQKNDNEFD